MSMIRQQKSQRMLAGLERNLCRCAAVTEVHMIGVSGNRQPQIGKIRVDQQVMMTRIGLVVARFDDGHALDPKLDVYRVGCRVSIRGTYEKYPSALRRRGKREGRSTLRHCFGL